MCVCACVCVCVTSALNKYASLYVGNGLTSQRGATYTTMHKVAQAAIEEQHLDGAYTLN